MNDMSVADIEFSDHDDIKGIRSLACFEHVEHCEYIIYIGGDVKKDILSNNNLSEDIKKEIKNCLSKYICFYA